MADTENEKDAEVTSSSAPSTPASGKGKGQRTGAKTAAKTGAKSALKSDGDGPAQASVRDLVASAGAAFGFLDEEAPAQQETEPLAAESAPEVDESGIESGEKKKRSGKNSKSKAQKRSRSSDADVVASIEWSNEAKDLDFVQPSDEPEFQVSEESLSAFEELARRVAATITPQHAEQTHKELNESSEAQVLHAIGDPMASIEQQAHEAADAIIAAEASDIAQEMAAAHGDLSAESLDELPNESGDAPHLAAQGEEAHVITDTNPSMESETLGDAATDDAAQAASGDAIGEETAEPMEQTSFGALEEKLEAAEEDAAAEPTEFVDSDQLQSIIESLLFSTDKPVSVATIKGLFKNSNVRTKDISRALDMLASEYASATRGVTLEEVNGGYQLRTKSDNADFMKRLAKVRPFRLSGPALEVMSIVAYKQPVTKHEIDEIRGVESGHLLRALMERSLVAFGEKSDLPGKPMTYNSTKKFLEIFNLRNIRELPTLSEIDELLPEGIGEVEEKETLSDITDSMSTAITGDSYSEGEEELDRINEQLKAVDTTSEFFEQEKQRERDARDRERAQDIRERIVVGEEVESKDRRWLDRYEAKLNAPAPSFEAAGETPSVSSDLEALTDESAANPASDVVGAGLSEDETDQKASDHSTSEQDEDEESDDDLSANLDWNEDDHIEEEDVDKSNDV